MATGSSQARARLLRRLAQWPWLLTDALRRSGYRRTLHHDAALGRRGEDLAHRFLQQAGLRVVARNYRHPGGSGEIDIIAREGNLVVFVEVKSRRSSDFGSPDRAIGKEKEQSMLRAARHYAQRAGVSWNQVRFDVVSVVFTKPAEITYYRDVFFAGRAI